MANKHPLRKRTRVAPRTNGHPNSAQAETLGEAAARWRFLIESAPDAMLAADEEGKIVLLNAQAERLFGYTRQQLIGKPVEALMPRRFRTRHAQKRAAYLLDARTRPMET